MAQEASGDGHSLSFGLIHQLLMRKGVYSPEFLKADASSLFFAVLRCEQRPHSERCPVLAALGSHCFSFDVFLCRCAMRTYVDAWAMFVHDLILATANTRDQHAVAYRTQRPGAGSKCRLDACRSLQFLSFCVR